VWRDVRGKPRSCRRAAGKPGYFPEPARSDSFDAYVAFLPRLFEEENDRLESDLGFLRRALAEPLPQGRDLLCVMLHAPSESLEKFLRLLPGEEGFLWASSKGIRFCWCRRGHQSRRERRRAPSDAPGEHERVLAPPSLRRPRIALRAVPSSAAWLSMQEAPSVRGRQPDCRWAFQDVTPLFTRFFAFAIAKTDPPLTRRRFSG